MQPQRRNKTSNTVIYLKQSFLDSFSYGTPGLIILAHGRFDQKFF